MNLQLRLDCLKIRVINVVNIIEIIIIVLVKYLRYSRTWQITQDEEGVGENRTLVDSIGLLSPILKS